MADFRDFRNKLRARQPRLGVVLRSAERAFAELVGLTGYDFAWIDMEHSCLELRDVETLILTLENAGCIPLVRVAGNVSQAIGQVLDMGARIVNVPHVDTVAEAEQAVRSAKYYPLGARGFSSCSRSNRQGLERLDETTMRKMNEESLVMVQVESAQGMQNLRAIAAVAGVDVLFLGLGDLSQDLGLPGDFQHPRLRDCAREFAQIVHQAGKISAIPLGNPAWAKEYAAWGFSMMCCGVDILLMRRALESRLADVSSRLRAC
jgi:4-hydroxy-2-oxoheptanedioate aldolase